MKDNKQQEEQIVNAEGTVSMITYQEDPMHQQLEQIEQGNLEEELEIAGRFSAVPPSKDGQNGEHHPHHFEDDGDDQRSAEQFKDKYRQDSAAEQSLRHNNKCIEIVKN